MENDERLTHSDATVIQRTGSIKWFETLDCEFPTATMPGYPECGPTKFCLKEEWIETPSGKLIWKDVEVSYD